MIQKTLTFSMMAILLSWGFTSVGTASIVLKLSDKQMVQKAARIVRGKVVRQYSKWGPKHRRIYTYTVISVLEHLKGKPNTQQVVIKQLGGSVGNIAMKVSGNARFQLGEEVLVFLEKIPHNSSNQHHVLAMAYGKFRILEDAQKRRYLVRELSNLSLASVDQKGRYRIKNAGKILQKPLYLDNFVKKIRRYVLELKTKPLSPNPSLKLKKTR